jgi:hypothetical protein
MRSLLVYLLLGIILGGILFAFIMLPIKIRHRKMHKYAEEIGYNLRNSGVDKYYENLNTDELLTVYDELNNTSNTIDYKKELYSWSEVSCKAKLVEDVLNARGVTIPEWK